MSQTPPSTKPYLIRAMHEWCVDSGLTPYMLVKVEGQTQLRVPTELIDKDGEIVFNISYNATTHLKMDNEAVSFKARFGAGVREVYVPVSAIGALYAGETDQGMAFDVVSEIVDEHEATKPAVSEKPSVSLAVTNPDKSSASPKTSGNKDGKKPNLTIIK